MTVHNSILRLADTVAVGPNRVVDVADMVVVRRSAAARKERRVATGGILRTARLWELNRGLALPSPGERVPIGFVVVGPAEAAVRHLTGLLRLSGRVPLMQLRLINPVDQAALERILPRCEQVIVLEPRPGVIETRVLAVAEQLRHRGQRVATIWGRSLPPDTSGADHAMASHRDLHPSILARKIAHLLHTVRPMSQMASHFVPDPPAVEADLPPRGAKLGFPAARAVAERVLEDVDGWLRDGAHQDDEERLEPTPEGLVIGGVGPADDGRRLVVAEVWDPRRFQADGIGALQQAARDDRPWTCMICDVRSDSA
jgi:TPP-dependent indolepyruvate ferredoxin oxidoreductase alpha subunit